MKPSHTDYDLLIIGGGINGAGIAADAAGRGLRVLLCEKSDLASATSWASTKLIHGGLRYLENYEFRLVRKSLQEREILARAAPHLIKPLAIQIPQLPHSRNPLLIRAGLFLYDNLARRKLFKGSRTLRFPKDGPLNPAIQHGFEYWDGFGDDTRLVVTNALQAQRHGAEILTRTECLRASSTASGWRVTLRDTRQRQEYQINSRVVVNAAGPWVDAVLARIPRQKAALPMRLVKGSHIVVPRLHKGDEAYLLQHHDGRVIFVIPYLNKFTLIGTTEEEFAGDLDQVKISTAEISYLISMVNLYFRQSILHSDVVYSFAGVRPLIDEAGESATRVSRDYRLEYDAEPNPSLTIYGGKITTYRVLAEEAVDLLAPCFSALKPAWTRQAVLPGGDFEMAENLFQEIAERHAWLGGDLIARLHRSYGTLCYDILEDATSLAELGQHFGHGLYQKEVDYLCRTEWAETADDILWRRSKLGYFFSPAEKAALAQYLVLHQEQAG